MDFLLNTLLGRVIIGALISVCLLIYRLFTNYKRSINMVFLKVLVPLKESKEDREREQESHSKQSDFKEFIGVMSQFFQSLHSIYSTDLVNKFKGQNFLSLEYA